MTETRKIAAILAADVVGFSRLAGADEDRTLALLRALRSDLIDPTIAVHHGRVVKRTGDGALVEFRSVVDAVRCAIEVQSGMVERNSGLSPDRRIDFRIGVHLGDIVEESDGDLMGDGVNIAARLEGIAKPGGICLSEDAFRQVKARLDVAVTDLGATQLKNIADPIRVYSIEVGGSNQAKPTTQNEPTKSEKSSARLALPDKPSITVLPFQNMSGDPEQEYFADGMVEDIITALSRFNNLFVIARNSSFTYKGRAVEIKQVGRELGVRYVLEGSVRKAGNRVRITAQLIDAATGSHLWADRFDGALEDIFDLQDQVTSRVVGAVAPKLELAEIERARLKPTESLDAYEYCLRGIWTFLQVATRENTKVALRAFYKAIDLDPHYAAAYGFAAWCHVRRYSNAWMDDRAAEVAETTKLSYKAVELGRDDAVAPYTAAFGLGMVVGDLDYAAAVIDRALLLNPNLAQAWLASGWIRVRRGEPELGLEHLAHARRLSPVDPVSYVNFAATAAGHLFAGRYDEAVSWAEKARAGLPTYATAYRIAAATHGLAGRAEAAAKALAQLRLIDPAARISRVRDWITLSRPQDYAKLQEGLRKAGMPE
jgi:adenylate cyclase